MRPQTFAVHSGRSPENGGPVTPPIAIANAYAFDSISAYDDVEGGQTPGFTYSRDGSPTSQVLEDTVAGLERAESAVAVTAGMAAVTTTLLSLLPERGTVLAALDVFGGTNLLLREVLEPMGYDVRWVSFGDLVSLARELDSTAGPAVVVCESVSNPLLQVPDLPAIADLAHARGARFVVDNTFATPCFCQPLRHGADIVLHSASKYLSGHADMVGGIVAGTRNDMDDVRRVAIRTGARLDPFGSWLALRGVRTLPLRMREAAANAGRVAAHLQGQPGVSDVLYPGLHTDPTVTRMLPYGHGAMVSLRMHGGLPAARAFVEGLELIRFVGSLGDVATSVSHPATTSHRTLTPQERHERGIDDGLLRLSIGVEHVDDIIADLTRGLGCATSV